MRELVDRVEMAIKEDPEALTPMAVAMSEFSLKTFNGKLLSKALDIARAIVDFEDELKNPS